MRTDAAFDLPGGADDTPPPPLLYRPLAEAARRLGPGRKGRPVHVATLTRWIVDGVGARDGSRIKLRAKRLPGRWVVTDGALDEFIERLTHDRTGGRAPACRPEAARGAAAGRADDELSRAGF